MKKSCIGFYACYVCIICFCRRHRRTESYGRSDKWRLHPEISGGGVVDYGTIHLSSLNAATINQLGQKDFSFYYLPCADQSGL